MEEFLSDLIECPVCFDPLDMTSRVLPCQHTFCLKCLEKIESTRREVQCPECRLLVEVPIRDLPPNILLIRLLEGIKNRTKRSPQSKGHRNPYTHLRSQSQPSLTQSSRVNHQRPPHPHPPQMQPPPTHPKTAPPPPYPKPIIQLNQLQTPSAPVNPQTHPQQPNPHAIHVNPAPHAVCPPVAPHRSQVLGIPCSDQRIITNHPHPCYVTSPIHAPHPIHNMSSTNRSNTVCSPTSYHQRCNSPPAPLPHHSSLLTGLMNNNTLNMQHQHPTPNINAGGGYWVYRGVPVTMHHQQDIQQQPQHLYREHHPHATMIMGGRVARSKIPSSSWSLMRKKEEMGKLLNEILVMRRSEDKMRRRRRKFVKNFSFLFRRRHSSQLLEFLLQPTEWSSYPVRSFSGIIIHTIIIMKRKGERHDSINFKAECHLSKSILFLFESCNFR